MAIQNIDSTLAAAVKAAVAPQLASTAAPTQPKVFTTSSVTVVALGDESTMVVARSSGDAMFTSADGRQVRIPGWQGAANVREWAREGTPARLADLSNLTAATFKAVMPSGQIDSKTYLA